MNKRLVALCGAAVILFGACAAQATPTPSATATPTAVATETPTATVAPPDVTTTSYKAEPAPAGVKSDKPIVLAEWQFPYNNQYYDNSFTTYEAMGIALLNLWDNTGDFKWFGELAADVPLTSNGGVVVNGDKMDLTVNLKPNMTWSDGQPITCADVEATWKWNMDPAQVGLASGTFGWEDIASVDGGTGTKCVVHFKKVFEGYFGLWAPLLPAHYLKTVPVADASTKLYPVDNIASGVYSGPYIPTVWKQDAQITFKANPEYEKWSGKTLQFPGVIFKYYGDAGAEIEGFKTGEFDDGMDLNNADIPTVQGLNKVVIADSLTYEHNALNNASLTKKFGADSLKTIKQALQYAYDKEAVATRLLGGLVKPINNFISPLTWYYKEEPAAEHSADKAKAALEAAGWTVGSDGFREKNGVKLALDYCTTTRQIRVDTLTLIASQLAAVGIKANVKPVPSSTLFGGWNNVDATTPCNITHGTFDVAEFAYISSPDPVGGYTLYHSQYIPDNPPHSGNNITRTNDPANDKLWDNVKTSVDFAKVRDYMGQVQDYYVQNLIEIPLYARKDVWLVNPKLHNFAANGSTATGHWNIEDWWMEK